MKIDAGIAAQMVAWLAHMRFVSSV